MVRVNGSLQPLVRWLTVTPVENRVCGEYFAIIALMVASRLASCCWTVSRSGRPLTIFCRRSSSPRPGLA
ncbi:Uncharacterised protein [Mycobacterium tuberculosis]|nr:Uncharacterised protein [Mycobacterium tuberculosis]COW60633.1 Uncharacterised protein [Mycobacterium tuberculosis]COW99779.1 Uncharacterised protein [Mycobacterium tuberculosis]